jgi:CheY-like chemotaxis protein
VVEDGAEALAAVQARDYDLVLMDIQMPVMDGVVATRHVRALQHPARTVPIIAMTASVMSHQVSAYFDAGMNGHISKPFKRDELYAAVARWSRRVPTEPPPAVTFDSTVFEGVVSLLGGEKTAALLERLAQQLQQFGEGGTAGAGRERIGREAHAMISSAGLLGFTRLSELCRRIEVESASGADLAPALAQMAELRRSMLRDIGPLKDKALKAPA